MSNTNETEGIVAGHPYGRTMSLDAIDIDDEDLFNIRQLERFNPGEMDEAKAHGAR